MKDKKMILAVAATVVVAGLLLLNRKGEVDTKSLVPGFDATGEAATPTVAAVTATPASAAAARPTANLPSQVISLSVSEPANGATVTGSRLTVRGKTAGNAAVFVNEKEVRANANGDFSALIDLEEGENYIYVVAADEFGNFAEKEITVNLET